MAGVVLWTVTWTVGMDGRMDEVGRQMASVVAWTATWMPGLVAPTVACMR